jgi:uncharacterized membrane protein
MGLMKKYFLTGLVILLPLAVTIAVLTFLINFFTKPFIGFVTELLDYLPFLGDGFLFLSREQIILYTSKLLILLFLFLATVFLGIVTRWFVIKSVLNISDKILHKIPIINTVYKTTQDIIKTLFASDKKSFQQVVMVPFPRSNTFVIGLISRESPTVCSQAVQEDLISVLVPTTPNPTTGFLLMYPRKDLIYVDMRPEDAVKYVVSCGVIIPPSLSP